jgi:hypothetical protein
MTITVSTIVVETTSSDERLRFGKSLIVLGQFGMSSDLSPASIPLTIGFSYLTWYVYNTQCCSLHIMTYGQAFTILAYVHSSILLSPIPIYFRVPRTSLVELLVLKVASLAFVLLNALTIHASR